MYVLNHAIVRKRARKFIPDGKTGSIRLWCYPAMLFNKSENAFKSMDSQVEGVVQLAKNRKEFVRLHADPDNPYIRAVECSTYTEVFRITDDTPED